MTQGEIQKKIAAYPEVLEVLSDTAIENVKGYEKHQVVFVIKTPEGNKNITNVFYILSPDGTAEFQTINPFERPGDSMLSVAKKALTDYYVGSFLRVDENFVVAEIYTVADKKAVKSEVLVEKDGTVSTIA